MLSKDKADAVADAAILSDSATIARVVGDHTFPLKSIAMFSYLYLSVRKTSHSAAIGASLIKDAVQFTGPALLFLS
jgi:hypothetical protein